MNPHDWRRAARGVARSPRLAVSAATALARGYYYRLKFRLLGRRVIIGKRFRVAGKLDIRGPGTVIFGDDCGVVSSRLAPTTPYTHSREAVIRFGNRVLLTGTRLGCEKLIEVGDNTGLSDARIMDTDFHALEVYDQPRYNTGGIARPVILGRNVWVGAGAMILKGVRIGDNAVVAAGSVVVARVAPNTVVLGNPARLVWRLRGPQERGSPPKGDQAAPSPPS